MRAWGERYEGEVAVRVAASAIGKKVRNATGGTLAKGRALAVSGVSGDRYLVVLADKDDPAKRPALGVLDQALLNNQDGFAISEGVITGLDTSMFALTDQLVLGAAGALIRPYPETDPFVGELQHIGQVTRVHASLGEIALGLGGLDQVFGLNRRVATSLPRSPTTSDLFQTKVSLVTPAAPGTYRVSWQALCDSASSPDGAVQLKDQTGAVVLDGPFAFRTFSPSSRAFIGGDADLVLSGSAKTLAIEWRSTQAGQEQGIQNARIELWRAI